MVRCEHARNVQKREGLCNEGAKFSGFFEVAGIESLLRNLVVNVLPKMVEMTKQNQKCWSSPVEIIAAIAGLEIGRDLSDRIDRKESRQKQNVYLASAGLVES